MMIRIRIIIITAINPLLLSLPEYSNDHDVEQEVKQKIASKRQPDPAPSIRQTPQQSSNAG